MQRRTENSTITVPVPNHKELRLGTLRSIIRQSQLPRQPSANDPQAEPGHCTACREFAMVAFSAQVSRSR